MYTSMMGIELIPPDMMVDHNTYLTHLSMMAEMRERLNQRAPQYTDVSTMTDDLYSSRERVW